MLYIEFMELRNGYDYFDLQPAATGNKYNAYYPGSFPVDEFVEI
jgi:hypothetical protein